MSLDDYYKQQRTTKINWYSIKLKKKKLRPPIASYQKKANFIDTG